jgi:hypothetical protein
MRIFTIKCEFKATVELSEAELIYLRDYLRNSFDNEDPKKCKNQGRTISHGLQHPLK